MLHSATRKRSQKQSIGGLQYRCETYTDLDACLRSRAGRLDGILGSRWAQRTLRAARMDGNGRFARRSPSSPSGVVRLVAATLPRGAPLRFRRRCSSRDRRDFLFHIARASQIDGEKRSGFNIGASGNFYRKCRDGRSLTLSSRPPRSSPLFPYSLSAP